jgi:PilZ domain
LSRGLSCNGADTYLRALISDLSLISCHLETAKMLPVGTEFRLRIAHNDATFTTDGVVARCEPKMSMGIRFTNVPMDQHLILEQWLAELSGYGKIALCWCLLSLWTDFRIRSEFGRDVFVPLRA